MIPQLSGGWLWWLLIGVATVINFIRLIAKEKRNERHQERVADRRGQHPS